MRCVWECGIVGRVRVVAFEVGVCVGVCSGV